MKVVTSFIFAFLMANAYSQVSFDKDLENLKEQKNQEIHKATIEVNRKYKQRLEALHRAAVRNGDVATALKIETELAALPAVLLIGKKHPTNVEELKAFLDGTTWSMRSGTPTGEELYTHTYSKKGRVKISDGRETSVEFLTVNTIRLWGSDIATLTPNFSQFSARNASGAKYYGVLVPRK